MFGFCIWDIVALIALIVVSAALIIQQKRHKNRVEEILKPKT